MRTYIAKIEIPEVCLNANLNTGVIGEKLFEIWFKRTYFAEQLHKQKADRDYQGIDYADEKGYTYQVKATKARTFTFNCYLDELNEHLKADYYVFIQIHKKVAYIESIYVKEQILNLAKQSWKEKKSCFVYAKDLMQQKLF